MFRCEKCGGPIESPAKALVRVTGWGRPNSKGNVDKLYGASAPHGYLCDDCGFDMRTKGDKTESLF